jgi:ABC-type phosphate transport system auxiliary subunit
MNRHLMMGAFVCSLSCLVNGTDEKNLLLAGLIQSSTCMRQEKPVTPELYCSHLLKTLEELVCECKNLKDSLLQQIDCTDNPALSELCDRLSVSINENNQIVSPDAQSIQAKALSKLLKRTKTLKAFIDQIHNKDLRGIKAGLDKLKKELLQELDLVKKDIANNQETITGNAHGIENIEMRLNYLETTLLSVEEKILLLADAYQELASTIGSSSDESANAQELDSVLAIDQAQLSLITWLKTVYKQLRASDYIS